MNKCTETKFQFTRHLMSCNNIGEGKEAFNGKDYDPAGTIYGIAETIKFAQINSNHYKSNLVYVSNLLRTWITSFLLYKPTTQSTLTLHVAPFLKEKHGLFKRGNYPKEIKHTAKKFELFLQRLSQYVTSGIAVDSLTRQWYDSLPNEVIIELPVDQKIVYAKGEDSIYSIRHYCDVKDTVGPKSKDDGYLTTGNLVKFMNWFESNKSSDSSTNCVVHVVTHSQVMQAYLLEKFGYNIEKESEINPHAHSVRHSNSWRFITSRSATSIPELVPGVPLKKEEAKKMEKELKERGKISSVASLCGIQGSIQAGADDVCMIGGKRRTKKNKLHYNRRRSKRGGSGSSEDGNDITFYDYDIPSHEYKKILEQHPVGTKIHLHPQNQEDMRTLTIELDENGMKTFVQTGDMYGDFNNPGHPDYIGGKRQMKKTRKNKLRRKSKKMKSSMKTRKIKKSIKK